MPLLNEVDGRAVRARPTHHPSKWGRSSRSTLVDESTSWHLARVTHCATVRDLPKQQESINKNSDLSNSWRFRYFRIQDFCF